MGTRLRSVLEGIPKGLVDVGGETLVGRSVRLLRGAGVERITIVAGYARLHYERFAERQPDVRVLLNDEYATTGSMASLSVALEAVDEDVLVLESDIIYEPRALTSLMEPGGARDATLLSGPTGAGDEVWVYAPGARLQSMSKNPQSLPHLSGELVGITRLSPRGVIAMRRVFDEFVRANGHGRMDYESGALVSVAQSLPVSAPLVEDLWWGEIDDERHLDRVLNKVWPALNAMHG